MKKNIKALYLIAPPFDDSLPEKALAGGFKLKNNLSLLEKQVDNLALFFSLDDTVVPCSEAEKYRKKLPQAEIFTLDKMKGHFRADKFPQLIAKIKKDLKLK
ncbi:MAG: hypothetical protein K9M44_02300 [Candidatus Pacebacteria bacterium]|nr:hypothetical protein [Candidatus Paceibacterota bacterium]